MSIKRIAIAGIIAATLTLTACTGTGNQNPTASSSDSPTPTPTVTTVGPPADEDEAISNAEAVLTKWFTVRAEVNASGGTDTASLKELATGNALDTTLSDAKRIAEGPLLNEDGENISGRSTTEGQITYETITVYGQEREGIPNGLVTINACQDATGYKTTTSDGKPAMRDPNNDRLVFDYQVIYDAERQAWLVYDLINTGAKC